MKLLNILLPLLLLGNYFNVHAAVTDSTKRFDPISEEREQIYRPTFRIYLGGFYATSNTSITINSERFGEGTTINLEKLLGLDLNIFAPRVELLFNFGKRHELGITFWTIGRERTRVLPRDIQFADTIFYANASLRTRFNISTSSIAYRYSIFEQERWNAGVSLGGKILSAVADLEANLNDNFYSVNRRVFVPVPLVGIHGSAIPGKNFLVRGSIEYFIIGLNDYGFRTLDTRFGVEYFPFRNVGFGADYHSFSTRIKNEPTRSLNGEIDFGFNAISLYVAFRI